MNSSVSEKFTGVFGCVRRIKKRRISGGRKFAMSRAEAPMPFDELIFAPPTRKNS